MTDAAAPSDLRVCYLGISDPGFSRNRTFIAALRAKGAVVHECFDRTPGWRRYRNLWRRHRELVGRYDVMVVGYPGQTVTWFARLLARGRAPVVLDALASRYEADILSRQPGKRRSLYALKMWLIDFVGSRLAHLVLVETDAQARYFERLRLVSPGRAVRVFGGADEDAFHALPEVPKRPEFTVIFRGRMMLEAGVRHIVDAAAVLAPQGVRFRLLGFGDTLAAIQRQVADLGLANVEVDTKNYPDLRDLAVALAECHVSLGQLEAHERLERTIPHKAFETAAVGVPYVTAAAAGIAELFVDGESALFVPPADPAALAAAILRVRDEPGLAAKLVTGARAAYESLASRAAIGERLVAVLGDLRSRSRRRSWRAAAKSLAKAAVPASLRRAVRERLPAALDAVRSFGRETCTRRYRGFTLFYNRGNSLVHRLRHEAAFEPELCDSIVAELRRAPGVLLDVGANVGLVTLGTLAALPTQRVVAFEPGPTQRRLLERTVAENGLADRVSVVSSAAGAEPGTLTFFVHRGADVAKDGLADTGRGEIAERIEVEVDTLDRWWRAAGEPAVSVIKVDTEGAEKLVVDGARELLRHAQPTVFFELEASNLRAYPYDAADVVRAFDAAGYAVTTMAGEPVTPETALAAMAAADTFRARPAA